MESLKKIKPLNILLDALIILLMSIAPIVHLAFGDWFDTCFNTISILSLIKLIKEDQVKIVDLKKNWYFLLIFIAYPLEIFFSQLFRWEWRIHDYLDQSRFILAFPIFLYLSKKNINYGRILEFILPISLIVSFLTTKFLFSDNQYGDRFSNNFSDPLAFGQITLSMSLILISSFFIEINKNIYLTILKILGIGFGVLISIKTQSRTGWASIIVIILLMLWINRKRINKKFVFFTTALTSLLVAGIYFEVATVHNRVTEAYTEIVSYPWDGHSIAPETSVGQRITFYKIGWFYIKHGHWYGWGERGFKNLLDSPELLLFSTKQTIEFCYIHLFHNELLTQTVRYGVFGFIGYFIVLVFPIFKCLKIVKHDENNKELNLNCIFIIVFLVSQVIAGVSDEVINLKHMVMYFSLLTAGLYASVVSIKSSQCKIT